MMTAETQKAFAPVLEMMEDGYKRWQALMAQSVAAETRAMEEARKAIDESARIMKEGLEYSAKMSAEMRRVCTEATEKAMKAARPQA